MVALWSCGGTELEAARGDGGEGRDSLASHDAFAAHDARVFADADSSADVDGHAPADVSTHHESGLCSSGTPSVGCLTAIGGDYVAGNALAVDDNNVYWVAVGQTIVQSRVMRTSRASGATTALAPGWPNAIVTDGSNVYWGDFTSSNTADAAITGRIVSIPVGGGSVTTLAHAFEPNCIAADDANIYWTDQGGTIGKVSKSGGVAATLPTGGTVAPEALAVDGTSVYWTGEGLYSTGIDGGATVTMLTSSQEVASGCSSLALVEGSLLVLDQPDSMANLTISQLHTSGPVNPTVLVADGHATLLAPGGSALYWVGFGSALEVNETSLQGRVTTTLAVPLANEIAALAVASDGTVFWTIGDQIQSLKP